MSPQSIYVTRHGTRQDFVSSEPFVSLTGSDVDPPLADTIGEKQAQALSRYLSGLTESSKIKHIFCSPFTRCLQTVRPFAESQGLPIKIDYGLGEWFKTDEPVDEDPATAPSLDELAALDLFNIDPSYRSPLQYNDTCWESKEGLHDRLRETVLRIAREYEDQGDILIVTHAAPMICVGRALCSDRQLIVKCGVASLFKVSKDDPSAPGPWRLDLNGETSYLEGGLEYDWLFHDERTPEWIAAHK
ncbi:histidine phosphatase superfamily [Polychytrium aggregatum]|uniref:histidine phosphatase superfamily n=1 Tax=Polychytrium aggregatum TaxID=110093 RepID=UPI0022FDFACA|nr:histidine phosphatase superfamily [Polychytrium aggregatum]KAI9205240.1 histidine phosphatase superfamily [Polychytrium aggregatum]